jgi:asparagine synthase (glutamine-hydrolysing)
MCGIAGIKYFAAGKQVAPASLEAMNAQMVHRGPDDSGYRIFDSFGMAMRRLSIIDLAGGHQPIANEDQTVWVVLNGEIYNFPEVRAALLSKGHRFSTHSDTEVLVHAYEEYGEDFVRLLNGMFGFALWDDIRKKLILGRDRLGVKPLYYYMDDRTLAFASEIKALTACEEVPRAVDLEALDEFLTFEYILAPRTMLQGVKKLLPGHLLILEGRHVQDVCYWTPSLQTQPWTEEQACHAVRSELNEAVKRRMISDVPLGAFLSGGIDSSIVVGLMSQLEARPVKTFSIGFDDASYNELDYARLVARHFGTDHTEEVLRPDPVSFLDNFTQYLDEPIGDVSIFPMFLVSSLARQKVTVALSGDGGDELFGGYDSYIANGFGRMYGHYVPKSVQKILATAANQLPPTQEKKGLINKIKRFLEGTQLPADLEQYRWMTFLHETDRRELYAREFLNALPQENAYTRLRQILHEAQCQDALNRQMYTDIKIYLPEDILVKVDQSSMARSLEARGPFLDYRVVELALSIPGHMKIRGSERKYILKKAFKDLLPEVVLKRKKEGFSIPMKNWLKRELQSPLQELLNKKTLTQLGFFNWRAVDRMVQEHLSGKQNHAHRLWSLMVFVLWHRKYIENTSRTE